jgi:hypothetical protein
MSAHKTITIFTPYERIYYTTYPDFTEKHCDKITIDWGSPAEPGTTVTIVQGDHTYMFHGMPFILETIKDKEAK